MQSVKQGKSWVGWLLMFLASRSGPFRKGLWLRWYNFLADHDTGSDLLFMNFGYASPPGSASLALQPDDEPYRYSIQLYHHVVETIDLQGKRLLEVGSGRGGGASYLARYRRPTSVIGVDSSCAAIARSNRYYKLDNLRFTEGMAEELPCESGSVDVVVNVESSHCYMDMPCFVREVYRVLRPGGWFAFCDLRTPSGAAELAALFARSGMQILRREVITENVIAALDRQHHEREAAILRKVPRPLRALFADFAGLTGSTLHGMLRDGRLVYLSYLLQKPFRTEGLTAPSGLGSHPSQAADLRQRKAMEARGHVATPADRHCGWVPAWHPVCIAWRDRSPGPRPPHWRFGAKAAA